MSNPVRQSAPVPPKWVQDLSHPANVLPISFFLALLVFAAFYPMLTNGFVNYDDQLYVTANPYVQHGLTWQNLGWAFGSSDASNWHPLTWVSHILDCQIFGLKPWGHHFTSLLLHTANTVLLFIWLRRFTGFAGRSLAVALLFGLHPLRVESVAWVAERKDVLSAFFWLLALLAYHRFKLQGSKSKIAYVRVLLFFTLGLLSKPMVVTFPFVLLLLDYWHKKRTEVVTSSQSTFQPARQAIIEKIPFFLLAAAASTVTFLVQKHAGAVEGGRLTWTMRVGNALVSCWRYVGKVFWPANLSVIYPYPDHWPMAIVLACGGLLLAVSVFAIVQRRERPWLLAGWFWFLGTLVPVIGLVQVGVQAMADRYTYIPSIGLLMVIVWSAQDMTKSWRHQSSGLTLACATAAMACIGITHRQIGYWKDTETLFRHAVAVTGNNWVAENGLGASLLSPGHFEEAIEHLNRAIRIYPLATDPHNNLGIALKGTGQLDDALAEYRKAIELSPRDAGPRINLGIALVAKGNLDEALMEYSRAVELNPGRAEPHYYLAKTLAVNGRPDEAIREYQTALQLRPDLAAARAELEMLQPRQR